MAAEPLALRSGLADRIESATRRAAGPRQMVRRALLPFLRTAAALVHARRLLSIWKAPLTSSLGAQAAARPEVWHLIETPFVQADWPTEERLARLIDHCRTADALGKPFDLLPNEYADLLYMPEIGPGYRLMLDQPRWLFRDGLLALSLWWGPDRLFSLAFLLGHDEEGSLIAYVGGVQGRRGGNALDQYRAVTKAAEGLRPRDLLIEMFRSLCATIGVRWILCVSNGTRHQRADYYISRPDFIDPVRLDYDAMWIERGASLRLDGMFDLPVRPARRRLETVPQRRRAQYRRRLALLDGLRKRLSAKIDDADTIQINQHEPRVLMVPNHKKL
jgi:uncharacterized protein VirK/YbjX